MQSTVNASPPPVAVGRPAEAPRLTGAEPDEAQIEAREAAHRAQVASIIATTLRCLLGLEVLVIAAAVIGHRMGVSWTQHAVALGLLLPMVAWAISTAADVSDRPDRRRR
jgi:hypothetical protein